MAENKKSFIAYSNWYEMIKHVPDELAGRLFKHIFSYVNDENPETDDWQINALFGQIKVQLKDDLKKWEQQREQRSDAGRKSAELRATKFNDRSNSLNEKERNSTVNVNVNVNDNVNVNENIEKNNKYDFVSDDFQNIVKDWLDYKKARKESYKSEKSIQAFYNKLQKLSGGSQARAVEIIEQSMANNWAGIFELKNKQISTKLDPNGDFKH